MAIPLKFGMKITTVMIFLTDECCWFFPKLFRDNKPFHILFLTIRDYSLPIAVTTREPCTVPDFWTKRFVQFPCLPMHKQASLVFYPRSPTPLFSWLNWFISAYRERWTLVVYIAPALPLLVAAWVGRLTPMQPGGPRSDSVTSRHSSSPANQCSNTPKWY